MTELGRIQTQVPLTPKPFRLALRYTASPATGAPRTVAQGSGSGEGNGREPRGDEGFLMGKRGLAKRKGTLGAMKSSEKGMRNPWGGAGEGLAEERGDMSGEGEGLSGRALEADGRR